MSRFIMESRPRLMLVYSDSAYASRCGRYFRRMGWEVRMVASGVEARRQFAEFQPTHLVVDADLPDESGWLTCAKILLVGTHVKLMIQVPERDAEAENFVRFLKADMLVSRDQGVEGLADALLECPVAQMA